MWVYNLVNCNSGTAVQVEPSWLGRKYIVLILPSSPLDNDIHSRQLRHAQAVLGPRDIHSRQLRHARAVLGHAIGNISDWHLMNPDEQMSKQIFIWNWGYYPFAPCIHHCPLHPPGKVGEFGICDGQGNCVFWPQLPVMRCRSCNSYYYYYYYFLRMAPNKHYLITGR